MNARLRAAVEQLPDEAQAALATLTEGEIADVAWNRSFSDPRSQTVLDALEAQLDEEIAAGEVHDWPDAESQAS